ncbi:MAG: hypothetical protein M0036_20360 [Desulfobacteraceae bacterium]|nr:hypothetical protein [Desulfobacteraceae bacterium]
MQSFQPLIKEVREFVARQKAQGGCREFQAALTIHWPPAGPRDIVLLPDLALELGHPEQASLCFLMWTTEPQLVRDNTITLIGPDIPEATTSRLPFGKVVLTVSDAAGEEDLYERYRQMDLTRFNISLKGFMLRATSQYLREWSRISREAIQQGFSFKEMGSALIRELKTVQGVKAAEVLFITQSSQVVDALKETGSKANRMIQALHKMTTEMEPECGTCEFQDVCGGAREMQALRKTLAERNKKK